MKKSKGIILISTLIINTLIFTSCSESKNKQEDKEIKIGITLYKQEDKFISNIATSLEETVAKKSLEENISIKLDFADAKGSSINQGNQVDKFISQNYDVICVNLVDRTAASTIIDKARKANIPIIFFNREPVEEDMNRWNKLFYVGAKAEESARLQAEIIIDEWVANKNEIDKNKDGKIQYVILEGEHGHQDTSIRTEYAIKALIEKNIEVEKLATDTANWQSDQAISKMNKWIESFGDEIEVVFSNNDVMALGAIHAINSNDIFTRKPLVVGIDGISEALEAVNNGEMVGTVISDYKLQAQAIFDISYALTRNKDLEGIKNIENLEKNKYIKTDHTKVNKENIKNFIKK